MNRLSLIETFITNNTFDSCVINYVTDDSRDVKKNTLFITSYHDQGLIPFKSLNKFGINFTLGLKYRRLSPAHGTAYNKKFKNEADTSSYISCMLF